MSAEQISKLNKIATSPMLSGQYARNVESTYQSLVENNESRRKRGLPEFMPSYELAEKIVLNGMR